jgi:hypothetical protein
LENPFPSYYVYIHFDPRTNEILYIGMGQGSRAYALKTSKTNNIHYIHRSQEHSNHLEELMILGWLPHEWIKFPKRNLPKYEALKIEKELIKNLKPKYNRKYGIKSLKFNKIDVLKIKELRRQGLFYTQIAKEMNCSPMVAHRIVNDLSPRYKELFYGE